MFWTCNRRQMITKFFKLLFQSNGHRISIMRGKYKTKQSSIGLFLSSFHHTCAGAPCVGVRIAPITRVHSAFSFAIHSFQSFYVIFRNKHTRTHIVVSLLPLFVDRLFMVQNVKSHFIKSVRLLVGSFAYACLALYQFHLFINKSMA